MAEWLAMQSSMHRDWSSIPAEVITLFGGIKNFEQFNDSRFELNLNFKF